MLSRLLFMVRGVVLALLPLFLTPGLHHFGLFLNRIVIDANGGKMPVASQPADVCLTLGNPALGVSFFYDEMFYAYSMRHQPFTRETKFPYLADCIAMERLIVNEADVPPVFLRMFRHIHFEPSFDSLASVGDLFYWGGYVLLLFTTPLSIFFVWIVLKRSRHV